MKPDTRENVSEPSSEPASAPTGIDPADVCTLSPDGLGQRLAWVREQILPHVEASETLADGIAWTLRASPGLAEKVDQWIALEAECCAPLRFLRVAGAAAGTLRLELHGVDPSARIFEALHSPNPDRTP